MTIQHQKALKPFPFELYLPKSNSSVPLVCITPLLGRLQLFEDLFLEKHLARFFAQNGLAAAVIDRPIFEFNPARGLEQIQIYLEESLNRNRQVLDALVTYPEIDRNRIASFGISFGAIVNCLWAASDSRIRAHVFALAGGDLPEIFITSRDPLMKSYLKAALESSGLDTSSLKEKLCGIFKLDPLKECHSIGKQNVLLFLALFDRIVQTRLGLALRNTLGKPETVFIPLGHYFSILAVPLLKHRALKFFKNRLF